MEQHSFCKQGFIYTLIAFAVLINFSGLFLTIMDQDAAKYASVAKLMVTRNDFINLYSDGKDWLDKPHFPFWITAFFFKLFGFTTWAYKLPGILFTMMGAFYTYLFAKKLYTRDVALLAALILLTAEHIILSDNDVRAEPYLTGLIIASVYHFYQAYKEKSFRHLLIASFFAGCAIMSKGIFALIPVAGAIGGNLLITKDWRNLFHIRWLIAAVLIFLFIIPELYCLYYQFDLHPEKVVFGKTNVSGLKFFFWDSQFGRFVNTGPIKGQGNLFFFFHTVLWAFLPWSILLYASFITMIRNFRKISSQEWFCFSGALLTFIIFSLSKFQLPYYLNIVFPFFAIITAQYFVKLKTNKTIQLVKYVQIAIICLLVTGIILLQVFYKPEHLPFIVISGLLILILLIFFPGRVSILKIKDKIIYRTVIACFFINFYLNFVFYPSLLHYQSGSEAAFWINKNNKNKLPVFILQPNYLLEFYLNQPVNYFDISKNFSGSGLIYIKDEQANILAAKNIHLTELKFFENFTVTRLNQEFINKNTRYKTLGKATISAMN